MEPVLDLCARDLWSERVAGQSEDVHFPRALARVVIERYTRPGDVVLDPFAGFGTTLMVSDQMGRRGIGIELVAGRVGLMRSQLPDGVTVIEGDARRLGELDLGDVDLCFTSPPYMSQSNHPQNPLTGYSTLDGDYGTYLAELTTVFVAARDHLRPGGHLVINAANIRSGEVVTPLAWDITAKLRPHYTFLGETYLRWDHPLEYVSADYLLTFRAGQAPTAANAS